MRLFVIALLITLPWLNPFSPGPSAAAVPLLFAWACAAGLLLLKADGTTTTRADWVRAMGLAWLVAAGLSAAIGLLQYFGVTSWFGVWVNHTTAGEAYGNLRQRNQFASLLNIGLAALVWWVTRITHRDAGRHLGQIGLALALAVLLAAGNAASGSRTGLFQLLLIVALSFWWQRRARHHPGSNQAGQTALPWVLLAAVLAYALATWALPWLLGLNPMQSSAFGRLSSGNSVCGSRVTLWQNVLFLIGEKPWLGWGWGELDYAHFMTLYPGARFCDILDNAHNLPLQLAVELGVPLAVALCSLGLWLLWRARPWRELDPARQLAWAVLAVILLHSLLEYPLWYGPFQMAAGLCVWLLLPAKTLENKPWLPYLQAAVAGMLLAFCFVAAWQYHLAGHLYLTPEQRDPGYRSNTLEKTRQVVLFQDQVLFAELTTTDLSFGNAAQMNRLAKEVLHFSPEARVAEIVIDSALLLGHEAEAGFYLARLRAAFPQAYTERLKRLTNN